LVTLIKKTSGFPGTDHSNPDRYPCQQLLSRSNITATKLGICVEIAHFGLNGTMAPGLIVFYHEGRVVDKFYLTQSMPITQ